MNSQKKVLACIFVLLISILIMSTPAWANQELSKSNQEPEPTPREPVEQQPEELIPVEVPPDTLDLLLAEKAAEAYGLSAGNLQVEYKQQVELPLTGQTFTYAKLMDVSSSLGFDLSLDAAGNVVDGEVLRATEKAAYQAAFGKLHPSLAAHLASLTAEDRVMVSFWVDTGGREASLTRTSPEQAESMSVEDLTALEAQHQLQLTQILHEAEQPLLDLLPSLDASAIEAADTAPLVFAEVPVSAIAELEALTYVVAIDLVVEGGPEGEDGGDDKTSSGPELSTARPASKANIVEARGFDGTGVIAAVVEGDSIKFDNPYLDGTCGPNAGCPTIDEHGTAVGGILASTHSTYRGTAPGIGSGLRSANGGGWDLPNMQTATNWATGQNASVLNNSYYLEADGSMHNSDRWLDYIVRNYADLEVKSAGNQGGGTNLVTSPGLGYNVLTVGSVDDKSTLTWDDDIMSSYSSYMQPAGREKPEVSAVGCSVTGGSGITSTGTVSPWVYDQGCGTSYAAPIVTGGGALLLHRASSLESWPEAEKAILIAAALHDIVPGTKAQDGAGAVDLAAADTVAANGWWRGLDVNPGLFDPSNNYAAITIYLYAGEPVRTALAYDSNPSADYTADPLEGDLDLYLINPTGSVVASSAGVDSWEFFEYTPIVSGNYTVRLENHGGSFSGGEWTFAGLAIWPGHYVLSSYVSQVRDQPSGAYNQDSGDDYRFTRASYWNAVGIRNPSADYDVFLYKNSVYADPADHAWLEDSTLGDIGVVDFVLVDGNHAPSGSYYATVSAFSGTGNYTIQQSTWTADMSVGIYGPYSMASSDVLRVWDTYLDAGVHKYFAVRPSTGDADLGIALFDSDDSTPATYYLGRSQSVAAADMNGAGISETMDFLSPVVDWMGLVVWNNASTTTTSFFVYADTTAPTGSIAINAGSAYANSTSVTLTLSGVDAQTNVYQMRFSSDGVSWGGWEAYGTTKAWTLAAGDGTRTVYVQYKNNAEMVSSDIISDTIILDSYPPSSNAHSPLNTSDLSFTVNWSGSDALSGVVAYDVQYRVGAVGVWTDWKHLTLGTSAVFGPDTPVVVLREKTYYFRVRAYDGAGNMEAYPGGNGDSSTYIEYIKVFIPLTTK